MTSLDQVRDICNRLPGAIEGSGAQFGFGVLVKGKSKGFCWSWLERIHPKKARVPNERFLAVKVPNLEVKEMILASDDVKFFTEAHYNGYAAVLVRLDEIEPKELEEYLIEGWRSVAPKDLLAEFDRDL